MTNSNSTYPKEWIAQDSIQMQSELAHQMNNECEIGTIGKYVIKMSLEDLYKIADREVKAYSESLEHEVGNLQWKLEQAIEALKFYAADENYYMHGTYGNTNVRNDNGKIAKEALNSIEKG